MHKGFRSLKFERSLSLAAIGLVIGMSAVATASAPPVPTEVKVDGTKLVLNGTGIRKATIFKVRVYEASLYLKEKSSDAAKILTSASPKQMNLRFLRSVDAKDIAGAWEEGFKKNCENGCEVLRPSLEKLKAAVTDLKEGDLQTFSFDSKGIRYSLNGKPIAQIMSSEFGAVLLALWLGKHPPNEDLREGLLGK